MRLETHYSAQQLINVMSSNKKTIAESQIHRVSLDETFLLQDIIVDIDAALSRQENATEIPVKKPCSRCHEVKEMDDFCKGSDKFGKSYICRECDRRDKRDKLKRAKKRYAVDV